jgi:hypothetical protein
LRRILPTDDDDDAAANDDDGGSPAKTEQDDAADSSTGSEFGGAAAFAATHARCSSRTEEFPVEQHLRITRSTTQQSNDRTGAASRSALTVRRLLEIDRSLVLVAGLYRRLRRAAVFSRSSRRFRLARPAAGRGVSRQPHAASNEHDTTIKHQDGCCKPFCAQGTSLARIDQGAVVAPKASPSQAAVLYRSSR